MNLRKRHLAIASIIAMVGALAFVTALLWSSGWVHAQGGSLPEPPTEEAATRSYQSLVWYDEQNTTPGLYQHRYYVCSYATPQICSEKQKGSWRFVDITSTPFPAP